MNFHCGCSEVMRSGCEAILTLNWWFLVVGSSSLDVMANNIVLFDLTFPSILHETSSDRLHSQNTFPVYQAQLVPLSVYIFHVPSQDCFAERRAKDIHHHISSCQVIGQAREFKSTTAFPIGIPIDFVQETCLTSGLTRHQPPYPSPTTG